MSVCLSVNIFKLEYLRNQWANRNEVLSEPSLSGGKLHGVFGQIYGKPFYYLLGNVDILFIYKISYKVYKISNKIY